MAIEIHVLKGGGTLPTLAWQWDVETGILSGAFMPGVMQTGYTGTVEMTDEEGSTVLLDISGGVLCGVDMVVWPEMTALPGLAAPVEARVAQVVIPGRSPRRGAAAMEFDTTISMAVDPAAHVYHLRVGTRRPVEPIRVADKLLVEVDAANRLAGLWLDGVPSRPDPA
jgi:hypothetical protein